MIVMREGNRGQTKRFQVFRRMEIGERPVCPHICRGRTERFQVFRRTENR